MRSTIKLLDMGRFSKLIFLLVTLVATGANAQWKQTSGINGGQVNCLAVGENRIYAGTNFGVYASHNNGENWHKLTQEFSLKINALLSFKNQIYAATDEGVYIYSDELDKWKKENDDLKIKYKKNYDQIDSITSVLKLARDSKNIYAIVGAEIMRPEGFSDDYSGHLLQLKQSLFCSRNSGKTWQKFNTRVLDRDSIRRRNACKNPIENINDERDVKVYCMTNNENNVLYVGTSEGIFCTQNEGKIWESLNKNLPDDFIPVSISASNNNLSLNCKVKGQNETYFSNDWGKNWVKKVQYKLKYENDSIGIEESPDIEVKCLDSSLFGLYSFGGTLVSTDAGEYWKWHHKMNSNDFVRAKNFIFAAASTFNEGPGIYRSDDKGETWKYCSEGINLSGMYTSGINSETDMYCSNYYGKVYRYNGSNWTEIQYADSFDQFSFAVGKINTFRQLFGKGRQIYATNTDGKKWNKVPSPSPNDMNSIFRILGDSIVVGTSKSGLFLSIDNGENWKSLPGTNKKIIGNIYLSGKNIFYSTEGNHWFDILNKLPDNTINKIMGDKNAVYASNENGTKYFSFDHGLTWFHGSQKLPSNFVRNFYQGIHIHVAKFDNIVSVTNDGGISWFNTDIDVGGYTQISIIDSVAFMITSGSLYKFDNVCKKWIQIENEIISKIIVPRSYTSTIMFNNSKNLFILSKSSLYRSRDLGTTWKLIGNVPPIIDKNNSYNNDYKYVNTSGDTLQIESLGVFFTSTDDGETWKLTNFKDEAKANCTVSSSGILFSTVPMPVVSYDHGKTWNYVSPPEGNQIIDYSIDKDICYVLTYNQLYAASLKDFNWYTISLYPQYISFDLPPLVSGKNIIAKTDLGICFSLDLGKKWNKIKDKNFMVNNLKAITMNKETAFALLDNVGLFKSDDYGKRWKPCNGNLPTQFMSQLTALKGKLFAWMESHDSIQSGLYVSENNGSDWQVIPGSIDQSYYSLKSSGNVLVNDNAYSLDEGRSWKKLWIHFDDLAFVDSSIFALVHSDEQSYLLKSTNLGETWDTLKKAPFTTKIKKLFSDGTRILIAYEKGIFSSNDNGNTWKSISGLSDNTYINDAINASGNFVFNTNTGDYVLLKGDSLLHIIRKGEPGQVNKIEVYNGVIYAATSQMVNETKSESSIFSSSDLGRTWLKLFSRIGQQNENAVFNRIIVNKKQITITSKEDVFVSDDNGKSWHIQSGIPAAEIIEPENDDNQANKVKLHSIFPVGEKRHLMKCRILNSDKNNLYYSNDNGKNWKMVLSSIYNFWASDSIVIASVDGYRTPPRYIISQNYGQTWDTIKNLENNRQGEFYFLNNKIFSTSYNEIFVSTDKGLSWKKIAEQSPGRIQSACLTSQSLVVSANNGLFISKTEGKTWIKKGTPVNSPRTFLGSINDKVFLGTDSGMFVSNDDCNTWQSVVFFAGMKIYSSKSISDTLWFGAVSDMCGLHDYFTVDGTIWLEKNTSQVCEITKRKKFKILYDNNETDRHVLYGSTDYGMTWLPVKGLPNDGDIRNILILNGNIFAVVWSTRDTYNADKCKTYFSKDQGTSWREIKEFTGYKESILAQSGKMLVAFNDNIYYSDDKGESWKPSTGQRFPKNKKGYNSYYHHLVKVDNKLFIVIDHLIYRSDDNGLSWKIIWEGLSEGGIADLQLSTDKKILLLRTYTDNSIFVSVDLGVNWKQADKNFPIDISAIQTSRQKLFSCSYGTLHLADNSNDLWKKVETGISNDIKTMAYDGEYLFCLVEDKTVKKSKDQGENWEDASKGINAREELSNMVMCQNELYVSSSSEVYRLKYHAENWEQINNLPNGNIGFLSTMNDVLYLGTSDGVFSFDNKTETWNRVSYANCNGGGGIFHLNSELYVEDNKQNIYHSVNNGKSWNLFPDVKINNDKVQSKNYINLHQDYLRILSITQHKSKLYACVHGKYYPNCELGLICSDDTGRTWYNIGRSLPFNQFSYITHLAFCENEIYAAISSAEGFMGEYITNDEGKTWKLSDKGIPPNVSVASILKFQKQYIAFTSDGVYVSNNNGSIWKRKQISEIDSKIMANVATGENGRYFVTIGTYNKDNICLKSEVFYTDTSLNKWHSLGSDTSFTERVSSVISIKGYLVKKSLEIKPDVSLYSGYLDEHVSLSSDLGKTWKTVLPDSLKVMDIQKIKDKLYCVTESKKVLRSDDSGNTWLSKSEGLTSSRYNHIMGINNSIVAIDRDNNIFISNDEGENWKCQNCLTTQVKEQDIASYSATFKRMSLTNGDSVMLHNMLISGNIGRATNADGVWYNSLDSGKTWLRSFDDISTQLVYSIKMQGNNIYLCTKNGLFASSNQAGSWELIYEANDCNYPLLTSNDKYIAFGFKKYKGSTDVQNIFVSNDHGKTWKNAIDNYPTGVTAQSLEMFQDKLFAFTNGRSVWSLDLQGLFESDK